MIQSILDNLKGALRFSGRQPRHAFWPYAILVAALVMTVGMVPFYVAFAQAMTDMSRYAVAHPEQTTVVSSPGQYSVQINGDLPPSTADNIAKAVSSIALAPVIAVLLLAASVTRRLHDTGRRGYWGLMPLPFLAFNLYNFPRLLRDVNDLNLGVFLACFLSNLLYMAGLVGLIFLLCIQSKPAGDRFGIVQAA